MDSIWTVFENYVTSSISCVSCSLKYTWELHTCNIYISQVPKLLAHVSSIVSWSYYLNIIVCISNSITGIPLGSWYNIIDSRSWIIPKYLYNWSCSWTVSWCDLSQHSALNTIVCYSWGCVWISPCHIVLKSIRFCCVRSQISNWVVRDVLISICFILYNCCIWIIIKCLTKYVKICLKVLCEFKSHICCSWLIIGWRWNPIDF